MAAILPGHGHRSNLNPTPKTLQDLERQYYGDRDEG
jgi:hypothetical protein